MFYTALIMSKGGGGMQKGLDLLFSNFVAPSPPPKPMMTGP